LSTPVVNDTAIAVADYQGYVHWLDKTTGELVARVHVKKQRVSNPPVGDGNTVVVLTDGGSMAAYRSTPRSAVAVPAAVAPPPASEPAAPEPAAPPAPATPPPPQ
jgi:hypothetical protein